MRDRSVMTFCRVAPRSRDPAEPQARLHVPNHANKHRAEHIGQSACRTSHKSAGGA